MLPEVDLTQKVLPEIFSIKSTHEFEKLALDIFYFQARYNNVYKQYLQLLKINPATIRKIKDIPFLPIQFFKTRKVITGKGDFQYVFESSGTTGSQKSRHYVRDAGIYDQSILRTFQSFYGAPEDYCFLALLPSYLERKNASLAYMADLLIKKSKYPESGFFLNDLDILAGKMRLLRKQKTPTILIGVTFALLDLAELCPMDYPELTIIETGGMKGRRREPIREEVHGLLSRGFGTTNIHSEYGMTELLSQAYSKKNSQFCTPPWMKILIREVNDPFSILDDHSAGCINIIDLANIHSCSFIATEDIGLKLDDHSFEVAGRMDNSEQRGCNLLVC